MTGPQHGEYRPGWGYYSAGTGNWHSSPSSIGVGHSRPDREPDQQTRDEFERQQAKARGDFKEVPEMESLIEMRESPHREKREMFEQLATGRRRMELHSYETAKASAQEDS